MRWTSLVSTIALLLAAPAAAQELRIDPLEPLPEPPAAAADEVISDDALIRWASNEVRLHEGRAPSPSGVPIPPASYAGVDGPTALPNEGERDGMRLLAEVGGGALGVLTGGGVAALIIFGALEAGAQPEWMMVAGAGGTVIASFAITAGVVLAGNAVNGRGSFGDAFIGQLVGSLAALPFITAGVLGDAPAVALVAGGLLPLCGAILGYEISHANRSVPGTFAFVHPTPGGALAGLAGPIP